MDYYVGKYKEDAPEHHGWILGSFMEESPRKTGVAEVKYWEFTPEQNDHPAKISGTLECTLILSGSCEGYIGDKQVTLRAGDYFVINPGVPNNLFVKVLEPTNGVTVKAPSDPNAKQEIKN